MKTQSLNPLGSCRSKGSAPKSSNLGSCFTLAAGMLLVALATSVAQPDIVTQPQSRTNVVGTDATFTVKGTNRAPLAYQWQKFVSPNWPNLANRTKAMLVLTNVQTSDAGDYRAVVTNLDGAVTGAVVTLTVWVPPAITLQPMDQAVAEGTYALFRASATGSFPLRYQWLWEGAELTNATNASLTFTQAGLTSAGGYALRVTNLAGAVTSRVAQLSVAGGRVFTNAQGVQVPYRLFLPPNYNPATKYPLVLFCSGFGQFGSDNVSQLADKGQFVFLTADNLVRHPCFFLSPQVPTTNDTVEEANQFLEAETNLLSHLEEEYSIDPDRVYVTGLSAGGVLTWAWIAFHPELLAAAVPMSANWPGPFNWATLEDFAQSLEVPIWYFTAVNDSLNPISLVDAEVTALRGLGAKVLCTRYQIGEHEIWPVAYSTPGLVNWVMAHRRGVAPTNEPLLSITVPSETEVYQTGATDLTLTGSAAALGEAVTSVAWTNLASNLTGIATGSNDWTVTSIPLVINQTNRIVVTATTTSWSAAYGGNTTFNDTLTVIQSPLKRR